MSKSLLLALSMVMGYEGYVEGTYRDPVGIVTACYGYTHPTLKMEHTFTAEQCNELLYKEGVSFEATFDRLVKVPTTPWEKAAGVSLMYNIGAGNFSKSTALRKLNNGDYQGFCKEFSRWIYSKGSVLRGLINRRTDESRVCEGRLNQKEWELLIEDHLSKPSLSPASLFGKPISP